MEREQGEIVEKTNMCVRGMKGEKWGEFEEKKNHVKVCVMEKNMIIWFTHLRTLTDRAAMLAHC